MFKTLLFRFSTILYARMAGILMVIIACCVMWAWLQNIETLQTIRPGWASMKFNTALAFLLSGIAVILSSLKQKNVPVTCARFFALCAMTLGAFNLLEHAFDVNLGIDQFFFLYGKESSGRMSSMTALCFLVFNSALYLEITSDGKYSKISLVLVTAGLMFIFIAVLGYVFDVEGLYKIAPYSSMAAHTMLLFILQGTSIIALRPHYTQSHFKIPVAQTI